MRWPLSVQNDAAWTCSQRRFAAAALEPDLGTGPGIVLRWADLPGLNNATLELAQAPVGEKGKKDTVEVCHDCDRLLETLAKLGQG